MKIFRRIKNYIQNPKIFKRVILNQFAPLIKNDELFLKMRWRISDMQYPLNLENPQTFCEKLQWLKLHNRKPIYTTMVDKAEAKKYVASIIGEEYIIPTIAIWDSADKIDWDILPNQFVMKCTHDSGCIVICKDKSKLNKSDSYQKMKRGLKRRYFWQNREWPYKGVVPRIIVEEYMEDKNTRELRDYKFFCFNGKVMFFKVDFGRFVEHHANYFSPEGDLLEFGEQGFEPDPNYPIELPDNLGGMISLAEKLSANEPFLRVDFYNVNGKIFFGELTFYPASGMGKWTSDEADYQIGKYLDIDCLLAY